MTEADLLDLIQLFYGPSFDLSRALSDLGPAASRRPSRITLAPRDPGISSAWLELSAMTPPGDPFVAGVVIRPAHAIDVDIDALREKFGELRRMPRVLRAQDVSYQLMIQGETYRGYMLLSLSPDATTPAGPVRRIILRRFKRD